MQNAYGIHYEILKGQSHEDLQPIAKEQYCLFYFLCQDWVIALKILLQDFKL